jgi:hypothetical protein
LKGWGQHLGSVSPSLSLLCPLFACRAFCARIEHMSGARASQEPPLFTLLSLFKSCRGRLFRKRRIVLKYGAFFRKRRRSALLLLFSFFVFFLLFLLALHLSPCSFPFVPSPLCVCPFSLSFLSSVRFALLSYLFCRPLPHDEKHLWGVPSVVSLVRCSPPRFPFGFGGTMESGVQVEGWWARQLDDVTLVHRCPSALKCPTGGARQGV